MQIYTFMQINIRKYSFGFSGQKSDHSEDTSTVFGSSVRHTQPVTPGLGELITTGQHLCLSVFSPSVKAVTVGSLSVSLGIHVHLSLTVTSHSLSSMPSASPLLFNNANTVAFCIMQHAPLTSLEGRETPTCVLQLPVPSISCQCPPGKGNMAFCFQTSSGDYSCSCLALFFRPQVFSVPWSASHAYPGTFLVLRLFCFMFFQLALPTFMDPGVAQCAMAWPQGSSHSHSELITVSASCCPHRPGCPAPPCSAFKEFRDSQTSLVPVSHRVPSL